MAKIVELVAVTDIGVGSGDFWVKVIDYDGTVLLEKRGNNGDSFDLPSAPSHEGLVFQEWSASCPITDGKVVIDNNNIMAGAIYTTASGQNEFDITLTKVTGLAITLNMDGTKDWGDGTSDTNTTHTYTAYGDYTIKCNGTTMTTSSNSGLFGQSMATYNYYCTAVRLATNSIGVYAFQYCCSLTSIVIPNSVTSVGTYVFQYCYSLTSIVIPNSVTSMGAYAFFSCYSLTDAVISNGIANIGDDVFEFCHSLTNVVIPNGVSSIGKKVFYNCFSLTNIVIPNGVTSIGTHVFYSCYSLTNIVIPNGVTSIGALVFNNCRSLIKYDFSQYSGVLTMSDSSAFNNINKIAKIIVPDSLYDEWIAAANWSTYANYIYKASEVTA